MLAVVLALTAAVGYGGSDFAAGLASRSAPVIQITLLASVIGGVIVAAALPFAASPGPNAAALAWGFVAGLGGTLGAFAGRLAVIPGPRFQPDRSAGGESERPGPFGSQGAGTGDHVPGFPPPARRSREPRPVREPQPPLVQPAAPLRVAEHLRDRHPRTQRPGRDLIQAPNSRPFRAHEPVTA